MRQNNDRMVWNTRLDQQKKERWSCSTLEECLINLIQSTSSMMSQFPSFLSWVLVFYQSENCTGASSSTSETPAVTLCVQVCKGLLSAGLSSTFCIWGWPLSLLIFFFPCFHLFVIVCFLLTDNTGMLHLACLFAFNCFAAIWKCHFITIFSLYCTLTLHLTSLKT